MTSLVITDELLKSLDTDLEAMRYKLWMLPGQHDWTRNETLSLLILLELKLLNASD